MRNMSLLSGERQVAQTLAGIERWHIWRYNEAIMRIYRHKEGEGACVIDLGCGVGYGTYMLSLALGDVVGVDDSQEAIDHALKYFNAPNIKYICQDVMEANESLKLSYDWCVAYEIIEHIQDNDSIWKKISELAPRVILSVPDKSIKVSVSHFHHRHFTPDEVRENLDRIGFEVVTISQPRFKNGLAVFCVAKKKGIKL